MKYWDTSALVALFVQEEKSSEVRQVLSGDSELATWWGTSVECSSAFHRLRRDGGLSEANLSLLKNDLEQLMTEVDMIPPTSSVKARALRLLSVHPLRAGDALQLASALLWCQEQPGGAGFVTLDDRLARAARAEGFDVLP